jgi:thiamine monophosphate synthase
MSTFDNGELTPLGVENFDDAGDLMNELIDFYNSEPDYQALAEATRAWCRKYNVPFSH